MSERADWLYERADRARRDEESAALVAALVQAAALERIAEAMHPAGVPGEED